MRTFGLIGYPLTHSFSQKYFKEKFKREKISDCEFKNFPLENIDEFPALLISNPSLSGLSITIPYKQTATQYLNEVDVVAKNVGAVNCVKILKMENGKPKAVGYNTDVYGFEESIKPVLNPRHSRVLILGTGGAAKAVAYVLLKLKINFLFLSSSQQPAASSISYRSITAEIISKHTLIINTTPLGMFPNTSVCPEIPYEHLTEKHLLYDLIYNPEETLFLRRGKENGAEIKNGLEMLHLQAEKAWEIWNG